MVQSAIQAAENFNAKAGGRYEIEVHAGGVLGGMLEVFDLVRTGGIEMCDFSPDFIAGKDLVFGPQGLPFAFDKAEECIEFYKLIGEAIWKDLLEEKYNLKMLSLARSATHDWCGTKPIHTLEDWDGITIWVSGPTEAAAVEAMGASPVTFDWNDGYPAIEKGTVDGGIYGTFAPWMLKWEACNHFTVSGNAGGFQSSAGIAMNLDIFNDLPQDIQDLLVAEFTAHEDRVNELFIGIEMQAAEELEAGGAEVYYLPEDELDRWREATSAVAEDYFAQLDPADAGAGLEARALRRRGAALELSAQSAGAAAA